MSRDPSGDLVTLFGRASTTHLLDEYWPRLEAVVSRLSGEALWWRPHGGTNSVGNLLLHLEGNVRQWILSGLGGASDGRDRASEFAAESGSRPDVEADPAELLGRLGDTVKEAAALIRGLGAEALTRRHVIQGFEVSGLEAIYHVVEHFGWHAGQITWIAKERLGSSHGIAFYDESRVNEASNDGD